VKPPSPRRALSAAAQPARTHKGIPGPPAASCIAGCAAGGKNKAAPDRTFTVKVTDGELTVDFIQVVGAPKVNAIRLKRTGD